MKTNILFSIIASLGLFISVTSISADNQNVPDSLLNNNNVAHSNDCIIEEPFKHYIDSIVESLYVPIVRYEIDTNFNKRPLSGDLRLTPRYIVNDHVPTSIQIDTSRPVGEIPITSDISKTGARTYNVPISVPAGMNGFQPGLSLSYNSQRGNSSLGMGWDIAGLSSIRRGNKSLYFDNWAEGIQNDSTDVFFLDGMRLIKTSKTSSVIRYESEIGLIKAAAYYSGEIIRYFKVYYPDGRECVYGYTNNSANQLEYPMVSQEDLDGNGIQYTYTSLNNHYYISTISYNTDVSISFSYTENRPDPQYIFSAGLDVRETRLLNRITCEFNNITTCEYILTYTHQDHRSLLTQIDYTSGSHALNPLRFYYGEGLIAQQYGSQTALFIDDQYDLSHPELLHLLEGKIDFNGKDDGIVVFPNADPYFLIRGNNTYYFYNCYGDSTHIYLYTSLQQDYSNSFRLHTGAGFVNMLTADVHGTQDYANNVIKINNRVVGGLDQIDFHIYSAYLNGIFPEESVRTFSFPTAKLDNSNHWSVQPKFYFPGDFNGDGRMEIFAISAHQPLGSDVDQRYSMCYLFDLHSNQLLYQGSVFNFLKDFWGTTISDRQTAENYSDKCFVMDFDGDGKSDICHVNNQGLHIYTFDISAGSYTLRPVATFSGLTKNDLANRTFYVCEFNGDGLMDILVSPSNASTNDSLWRILRSKGDGQFSAKYFTGPVAQSGTYFLTHDVNGDGLTDVIATNNSTFTTYLTHNSESDSGTLPTAIPTNESILATLNFNSTNNNSQLLCLQNGCTVSYAYPRNEKKETMLTGMANSLGVIQRNRYGLFNEQDSIFSWDWTGLGIPSYPYTLSYQTLPVITQSEQFYNNSRQGRVLWNYVKPTYHLQGRGFCGFQKIAMLDARGFIHDDIYETDQLGVLWRQNDADYVNKYYHSIDIKPNKTAQILLQSKEHEDRLTHVTDTTTYTYNTYGYPLTERTVYSDGNVSGKQNTYYNSTVLANYYLGYPKKQITYRQREGKDIYQEKKEVLTQTLCKPQYVRYTVNNQKCREELYSYDSHGNVTSYSEIPFLTGDTLTTTYTYDTYGRPTQKTDPMGFSTSYVYDSHGRLSTETDYRGGITMHSYDDFDRDIIITNPDSTVVTNTYSWSSEGTNGLYAVTQTQGGKPTVKTVYDALNREVRNSTQRFDGNYLQTDRLYNDHGLLWKESLPFKGSTPSLWKVNTYDNRYRLISVAEPSGHTTTYSYYGTNKTTTENGIATTRTYDSLGGLISVTDPGGTITYDLDSDDQPSSITAPGDFVTSFTYDTRRRRTAMTDPSAGTTTYTYKGYTNKIKTETDANGKTKSYAYDKFGRLTTKSLPEYNYNITYQYNNLNELASITRTNGAQRYFTYDDHGRVRTEQEKLGTEWLKKLYFYSDGKTDSIQYKTQAGLLVTEHYIYANGNFRKGWIKDPNGTVQIPIFEIENENGLGQPLLVKTGDLSRIYMNTSTGQPYIRKVGRPNSKSLVYVQNMMYDIEGQTSNLVGRTDLNRNMMETFVFDNLNRLTTLDFATISYDTKGNILQKSDVGTFSYNTPQKPYAISDATFLADSLMPLPHDVRYTSFNRPDSIIQNNATAVFTYNDLYDRVKMQTTVNSGAGNTTITDLYFGGCYEKHTEGNATPIERLYLFGDYYKAPAVLIKQGNSYSINYILRDYQGSITHVLSANGTVLQELSYDPWGRLRNPSTYKNYLSSDEPTLLLGRGYTGHEHLQRFGLINTNARLYDPMVSRFLSPDPYVQMPDNTQNFNRYSYCLNNPLKYSDESGELFFVDDLYLGLLKGLFTLDFSSCLTQFENSVKIWNGLFKTDSNKSSSDQDKELLSRFTSQLPQTMGGYLLASAYNMVGAVNSVDYLFGTTVIPTSSFGETGAITLGNFIIGNHNLEADPHNVTFQHEYGHYIQSQNMGPLYLFIIGIPSIMSASKRSGDHKNQSFERDANYLAYNYFKKHVAGFEDDSKRRFVMNTDYHKGWDFQTNPLYSDGMIARMQGYKSYYNNNNVLNSLPWYYTLFHF